MSIIKHFIIPFFWCLTGIKQKASRMDECAFITQSHAHINKQMIYRIFSITITIVFNLIRRITNNCIELHFFHILFPVGAFQNTLFELLRFVFKHIYKVIKIMSVALNITVTAKSSYGDRFCHRCFANNINIISDNFIPEILTFLRCPVIITHPLHTLLIKAVSNI